MANSLVSGVVRRLLPITTCTFSGAQGSQNLSYTVAKHLELGPFTEATLLWRRHSGTVIGTGATLVLTVGTDGYDFGDPSTNFDEQIGTTTVSSFSTPIVTPVTFTSGLGRMLRCTIKGTQPASPVSLIAVMSVDAILKGGDPTALMQGPNAACGYRVQ